MLIILVALAGLLAVAFLLWKYPVAVAFAGIAAGALCDALDIGTEGLHAGITIYPFDISCLTLSAACVVVLLRARSLPRDFCWPALILLVLGFLNFGRGVLLFGVKAPGNDSRDLIYLVLPAVAFAFLGRATGMNVEKLVSCLSVFALVLAVVAAARWAGVLAMSADDYQEEFRDVVRVLPSDYAIFIGQALIGIVGIQLIRGFRTTGLILSGIFLGLVFALQHRSVWTATLAGLAWLALRTPRLGRREWLKLSSLVLLLVSALTLTGLIASGPLDKVLQLFDSNVKEISRDDSTWAWRLAGYSEATERAFSNGPLEATVGPPSGRDISNTASFASIHIHDRFVAVLAYYGVVGLVALIAWLFSTAARVQKLALEASRDRRARINKVILEALLISIAFYFVPYVGGVLEGSLLGAIWLASATRRAGDNTSAPQPVVVLQYAGWATGGPTVLEKPSGLRSSQ